MRSFLWLDGAIGKFKEPIFLNPRFLISQLTCYSALAIHLYPPLGETDIRGGTVGHRAPVLG